MAAVTRAVMTAVIEHALLPGWKVRYGADATAGLCEWTKKTLLVPRRISYASLWIFFHELGHATRIVAGVFPPVLLQRGAPGTCADEEFHAEQFAIGKMRQYGFRVDRLVLADAKEYVRKWIAKDDRKQWPVQARVRKWATS